MSDTHWYRQVAGLAIVIVTYVGGIIGWSIAAANVEADSEASNGVETRNPVESRAPAPAMKVVVNAHDWSVTE